jgi:non-specific serine/threonine protein kinase
MAKLKNNNTATQLLKLGLNKTQMEIFFEFICETYWQDSIKIYNKLEIIRESLDTKNKSYVLIKFDKKSYDVNLEILNNELEFFCNCNHRGNSKLCAHAGAILLYKLLKEKNNDFNSKLKISSEKINEKKTGSDLGYFKELFPKVKTDDKRNMIYFNFEDFEKDKQILNIERGIIKKDGRYGSPVKFQGTNFKSFKWDISKNVEKVINFINGGDSYGIGYSSGFSKSRFYDANTDLMMPVLKDLYFEEQEIILGAVFSKEPFNIVFDITKNKDDNYFIEPFFVYGNKKRTLLKMDLIEIGNTSLWVFDFDTRTFYEYKNHENFDIARKIIKLPKKLELNEKELKEFIDKYYQKILNDFEFNISNTLKREVKNVIPKAKLYLEKSGTNAKVKLKFDYSGKEINYFSSNNDIVILENDILFDIHRDREYEDEIVEKINEMCIVTDEMSDEFVIEGDLIDFVANEIPNIIKLGVLVLGEENLFNFKIVKTKPKMNMNISKKSDWFEIKGDVKFGKESVDVKDVLEAIFKNKRFVRLSDGREAVIPKEWIKNLKNYSGFFDLSEEDYRLSKYHTSILDNLMELSSKTSMDENVNKIISNFKNFDKIKPYILPKGIKAELRNYQKSGFDWLCFLRDFGVNGVLADDMGLGKTLQTLSLLQKIKDEKVDKPFLVIVPTSLVFNWQSEIEKFTPDLNVYVHHGQKRVSSDPKKFRAAWSKKDLIITTYGVLRNDLKLFTDCEFEYIVLDEAQVIKNPISISAKSVFSLNGKNKLVISGTPIQNNLTDLWSLFHFLNPGYLGGYEFFKENFVIPIERDHDKNASDSLKKLINPFLFRRTKKIISDELPDKTEIILRSSFSKEEKDIYENWKEYYKNEIKQIIEEKNVGKSKMKILEGLMKLRQICLHPKMIDPEYTGSSSKFDLLMMEIEKVISEGHKVLVFSSFVKMLTLVKEEFDKKRINYSYLDGKTKDREKIVSKFQNSEEAGVFLISIKAGGLGLNLTSADYVFIIDPWWNPAVEMQAMDRAHRIGQENKVFVYKMIAEESIEEKILDLQKDKKKLVEDLIVEDEGLLKNINIEDIKKLFD